MKIIGLTGGIGSGKSTVSGYIKERGNLVIDADQIAREITRPGGRILTKLVESFGDSFIDENGCLKRKELGNYVFGNKEREIILNEITHKEIADEIKERLIKADKNWVPLAFLDIPLLFEVGMDKWCNETWLVTCDEELRVSRVMMRDGIDEKQVRERIESQMDDEEKYEKADIILYNTGSKEELYHKIDELLEKI